MEKTKFPRKKSLLGLLLVATLVLLTTLVTGTATRNEMAASEQCIMCHVEMFDASLRQKFTHSPVFERQCTSCHLPTGAKLTDVFQHATTVITGTLVSQEDLWRKLQIHRDSSGQVLDHMVSIPALERSTAYRFRLALSPQELTADREVYRSRWLGLRLDEMDGFSSIRPLDISSELSTALRNHIQVASLSRDGNLVSFTWKTVQPVYAWIELQALEGLNLTELGAPEETQTEQTDTAGQHPPLRTPEDLAINACYQCHPESTLGTSHPVRLYSGRDVRIPDDLPTVDGMLTCVTCHDPHGSDGQMLVREVIKTKLCVTCHYKYKNSSPSTMFQ